MSATRNVSEKFWCCQFSELPEEHQHPVMLHGGTQPVETYQEGLGFLLTFANAVVLDTDEGFVLIDCGSTDHGVKIYEEINKWSPGKQIHTCIYTHGHVDHCMGIRRMEKFQREKGGPPVRVIAHENVPARFDRYKLFRGYNAKINTRQFKAKSSWPSAYRYPDETYSSSMEVEIGRGKKEKLCLFHDKGETDDSTWVWLPERKAVCAGDLFIWATPNCGNPQKVQRYPVEWAAALRKMDALGAEFLFPGHGPPIVGKDRVHQALSDTAEFLESICRQTLEAINRGESLNDILHTIKIDQELMKKPYLRPVYDDPYFIVHNLWRRYCGWWDFDPAHLRPVANSVLAKEVCNLSGGVPKVIARAKQVADEGNLDLAVQLVEYAKRAAPQSREAHQAAAKIYEMKEKAELCTMAKGIYGAAKNDSLQTLKSNL